MSTSAPGVAESASLLTDYLLADNPGLVVVISAHGQVLHWPESDTAGTLLVPVESLDEAEAELTNLARERESSVPCVALLDLNGFEADIETLLGRAVRLFPGRLIVFTPSNSLSDSALFAFGFRKLDVIGLSSSGGPVRWFEYRLSHYKPSPDWLNARFWANPERFDASDDPDIYCENDESDDEEE